MQINREDMLELTRRMTVARNCFGRIAGAYMDEEGFVDGTFNTHFQKMSAADRARHLKLAKAVLFADTNRELKNYRFGPESRKPGSVWRLLMALRECELKNDALLLSLCEYIGERYQPGFPYGIYVFHGNYDVPLKGSDKVQQRESEEVYSFIVCAICPVTGDYEAGEPEAGSCFRNFETGAGNRMESICIPHRGSMGGWRRCFCRRETAANRNRPFCFVALVCLGNSREEGCNRIFHML